GLQTVETFQRIRSRRETLELYSSRRERNAINNGRELRNKMGSGRRPRHRNSDSRGGNTLRRRVVRREPARQQSDSKYFPAAFDTCGVNLSSLRFRSGNHWPDFPGGLWSIGLRHREITEQGVTR